ncbi:MAG: hypothetical protein M1825_002070 [Sarcosagium campestre]|nr:MAG: hypothetical protein M1825_002070 [Sarcosagium campestre]
MAITDERNWTDTKIVAAIEDDSAYNTREVLKLLPHIIPSPEQAKLRFVTVFFGANDACLPGTSSGQHIPLSEYRHNLVQILRHPSLAAHNARIILITPPPINEYQLESGENEYSIGRRRTVEHTKLYADAARQVGEDLQIVTLDLWEALIRKTKWDPSQTIPGSKAIKESPILREHLRDGMMLHELFNKHLKPANFAHN